MLDSLPDGIIIADPKQISYLNQEAWKLLGCQSTSDECLNIEDIVCMDVKNCSILTPLEQLINFLVAVDKRIANIDKDSFLTEMINLATDEAMLLHMHQGLASPCDQEVDDEGNLIVKQGEDKQEEDPDFNGVYYDVRIKTHYFGTQRQVVFVFTNVSAEKGLQREIVMKQYM